MADRRPFALWLLPERSAGSVLRSAIDSLTARFRVPSFEPHVTLASGAADAQPQELRARCAESFAGLRAIDLEVDAMRSTSDRFTALHLALSGASFEPYLASALRLFPDWRGPRVGPHLSLLYVASVATDQTQRAGREILPVPLRVLRCDRVALAWPGSGDWDDIESWQMAELFGSAFPADRRDPNLPR